jgi:hypothetical protein
LNNDRISQKVWELLLAIPTSNMMQDKFYGLTTNASQPDWNELLDPKYLFKLLYSLQIVDSIVFPLDETIPVGERSRLCHEFLSRGGIQHLCGILISHNWFGPLSTQSQDATDTDVTPQKNCLALVLKILDFFLHCLVPTENEASKDDLTALLRLGLPTQMCTQLLESIDFLVLIEKVINICQETSSQPYPDGDDKQVVTYAMRLLILCIIHSPEKQLPYFYAYPQLEAFILSLV